MSTSESGAGRREAARKALRYKVVETSVVTDEELEKIINERVSQGWALDGVQFAMRESSRRPAMAFVVFCREETDATNG